MLDVQCPTFMGLDFSPLLGGDLIPPAMQVEHVIANPLQVSSYSLIA
jgi:hypothetical protein